MTSSILTTPTAFTCSCCGETKAVKPNKKGLAVLPKGWKRLADEPVCQTCWSSRYVLRAVTLPVVGPVSATWPEFRQALAACWAESTRLSNWAITELAKADVIRAPGQEKMPPMPPVYLYGLAKDQYDGWSAWSGAYAAANSVLHSAEQRYRKRRFETIWTRSASLPTCRYPVPYPVHNQAWRVDLEEGIPIVVVTLAGKKFWLRLRGGRMMRRQLAAVKQIHSGQAVQGELALYRIRANASDHRNGTTDRTPGGGQRVKYRVMAKLVAWLPRKEVGPREGILKLKTDKKAFWIAEGERGPWILNADHVRRWIVEHETMLQRLSEDTKYEKRWPKRKRLQINEHREKRCVKHHRRLDTFLHQATAMLAGYAARLGLATVEYDDTDRSFVMSFPWAQLRDRLRLKLDEHGITLRTSGEVIDEKPGTAREV